MGKRLFLLFRALSQHRSLNMVEGFLSGNKEKKLLSAVFLDFTSDIYSKYILKKIMLFLGDGRFVLRNTQRGFSHTGFQGSRKPGITKQSRTKVDPAISNRG